MMVSPTEWLADRTLEWIVLCVILTRVIQIGRFKESISQNCVPLHIGHWFGQMKLQQIGVLFREVNSLAFQAA